MRRTSLVLDKDGDTLTTLIKEIMKTHGEESGGPSKDRVNVSRHESTSKYPLGGEREMSREERP